MIAVAEVAACVGMTVVDVIGTSVMLSERCCLSSLIVFSRYIACNMCSAVPNKGGNMIDKKSL